MSTGILSAGGLLTGRRSTSTQGNSVFRLSLAMLSCGLVAAACAPSADVVAVHATNGSAVNRPAEPGSVGTIAWSPCTDIADTFIPRVADPDDEISDADLEGWDCGYLAVPVDPRDPESESIQLAVTRREGTYGTDDALLFNPGGPGGSGVQSVWGLWDYLPENVQGGFDIVGWDPRGVWASIPAVTCPPGTSWAEQDLSETCEPEWGPLPGFMSTANTLADLEALRIALDQPKLNYVGYSYGTFVGALYARDYPDTVGRFVLDGSVSPFSATEDTPTPDGDAFYADVNIDEALSEFFSVCATTSYCSVGDAPEDSIEDIAAHAEELAVEEYPDNPALTYDEVWDTVEQIVEYPSSWALLSVALGRAADGDGTLLASLAVEFDTDESDDPFIDDTDNQVIANIAVYCADYTDVSSRGAWCHGAARNQLPVGEVEEVDVDTPILVIGNAYDPVTPLKHADEMQRRLGDAVLIEWRGIGHTAFPGNSDCIDDAVDQYLVDAVVPEANLRCPFIDGFDTSDVGGISDYLFNLTPEWLTNLVDGVLVDEGVDNATCLAEQVVLVDADAAVDVVLEVDSQEAVDALNTAHTTCD